MLKKILILLTMNLYLFGFGAQQDFLEPHEAFKTNFTQTKNGVVFDIKLGEDIYLYHNKFKFYITKPEKLEITKDLEIPKAENYDEFVVIFKGASVEIPNSLLKSKFDSEEFSIQVKFQGCSKAGLCYSPMKENFTQKIEGLAKEKATEVVATPKVEEQKEKKVEAKTLSESDSITDSLKNESVFWVLLTFFGFGLLLSLTPCIFPMIPILSSIIVKAGNKEEITPAKGFFLSLVYVLSMSIAYTIAGVVAGLFGANLQAMLQDPYVLVTFSLVFVALAFSLFGYYKLELPQSIQNKINKTTEGKEKQGVAGIAIMGFLSALIVGPCVAPPLAGALVYIGQTGDAFLGGAALFVLSFGMGIPLLLIGLGAGKFMPRPGGWMDSVSKVFGIVMLAIAVWMLDRVIPDLVIFLWAVLLIGAGLYLYMYKHIVIRTLTVMIFLYGVILFIGGVSGATNILKPFEKFTNGSTAVNTSQKVVFQKVKNIAQLEEAVKASSKPVMLDFWASWCVSCKELDNITFEDERVKELLSKFTLLKADVTENNKYDVELMQKFNVFGPPALIFYDTNNKEIKEAKIIGYKNPEEFLEIVSKHFK